MAREEGWRSPPKSQPPTPIRVTRRTRWPAIQNVLLLTHTLSLSLLPAHSSRGFEKPRCMPYTGDPPQVGPPATPVMPLINRSIEKNHSRRRGSASGGPPWKKGLPCPHAMELARPDANKSYSCGEGFSVPSCSYKIPHSPGWSPQCLEAVVYKSTDMGNLNRASAVGPNQLLFPLPHMSLIVQIPLFPEGRQPRPQPAEYGGVPILSVAQTWSVM